MNKIKYTALFSLFMFAGLFPMEQKDDEFRFGKGLICKEFLSYLTQLKELIAMRIPCEHAPKNMDDVLKDILDNKELDKDWKLKRALIATAVKAGASANTQARYTNPLHQATYSNRGKPRCDYYLSEFLLRYGANPNIGNYGKDEKFCDRPLHASVSCNKYFLTRLLLRYKANPNSKEFLRFCLFDAKTVKMAKLLLSYGADPHSRGCDDSSVFHSAMPHGYEPGLVALWLEEKELDPNSVDSSNDTPLNELMAWYNKYNSEDYFEAKARLLLQAGARLDIRNNHGNAPIDTAWKERGEKTYNHLMQIIKEVEQERERRNASLTFKRCSYNNNG